MLKKYVPYIISVAISLGVGGISAFLSKDNMSIYSAVNRPALSPPSWLFPIVWTVLFVLMGIAAAIIWRSNGKELDSALIFYGFQLVFNFCWPLIFFNFRAFGIAFFWLLVLLVLIGITAIKFYRINKTAGWMMLPYLAWVSFAGYLNYMIWQLNP
ncbi:MAG: tryptophan-rich sensory protein [Oscillospiraceae bacterium]|nr:tryptophan-rich sensory protein [Oscillospiraceae bacterium]